MTKKKPSKKATHVEWRLLWKGHLHELAHRTEKKAKCYRCQFHPEAKVVRVKVQW